MQISFILKGKAFSVNKYHYSDKRHKTKEARAWETQLLEQLEPHRAALDALAKSDWKEIFIEIRFIYPENVFYNAMGGISSRTYDLSNIEKPILDLVLVKTAGIDDKHVTELRSYKEPGADYSIQIKIQGLG